MQVYSMEQALRDKLREEAYAPVTYTLGDWGPVTFLGCYQLDYLKAPVARQETPGEWDVPMRLQWVTRDHQLEGRRVWRSRMIRSSTNWIFFSGVQGTTPPPFKLNPVGGPFGEGAVRGAERQHHPHGGIGCGAPQGHLRQGTGQTVRSVGQREAAHG